MRKLKSDADGGGSDHISGVDDEMDDKDREKGNDSDLVSSE